MDHQDTNTVETAFSSLRDRMDTAQRLCSLLAQNASIVHNVAHSKANDEVHPVHKPNASPAHGKSSVNNGNTPPQTGAGWIQRAVLTPVPLNLSMTRDKGSPVQGSVMASSMESQSSTADGNKSAAANDIPSVSGVFKEQRELLDEVERLNKVIEDVTRVNEDFQESTKRLMEAKTAVEEELSITRQALAEANANLQSTAAMEEKKFEGLQLQVAQGNEAQNKLQAELDRSREQLKKLHAFVQDERALNADLSRSATKIAIRNEELEGLVDHLEGELRMVEPQLLTNTPLRHTHQPVMQHEDTRRDSSESDQAIASKRKGLSPRVTAASNDIQRQPRPAEQGFADGRIREIGIAEFGTPGPLAYSSPVVTPVAPARYTSNNVETAQESRNLFENSSAPREKRLAPTNENDSRLGRSIDTSITRTLNDSALSLSPTSTMQRTRLRVDGKTGVIDIDMSPSKVTRHADGMTSPSARLLRITESLDSEFKDAEDLTDRLSHELHGSS